MAPMTGDALAAGLDVFHSGFSLGLLAGIVLGMVGLYAFAAWRNRP